MVRCVVVSMLIVYSVVAASFLEFYKWYVCDSPSPRCLVRTLRANENIDTVLRSLQMATTKVLMIWMIQTFGNCMIATTANIHISPMDSGFVLPTLLPDALFSSFLTVGELSFHQ
jgi:hypothetical protein